MTAKRWLVNRTVHEDKDLDENLQVQINILQKEIREACKGSEPANLVSS